MDYDKIDNLVFGDIDYDDYPDFCDAYILSGDYDGRELTEEELDILNDDNDFVYTKLMEYLY